jgi:hypothetical protein
MATLQVRDMDDRLYNLLKTTAKLQKRSISQEVVTIIENYLNSSQKKPTNATIEFLTLTGAWKDEKSSDEIIQDIRNNFVQSNRFGDSNGIFD